MKFASFWEFPLFGLDLGFGVFSDLILISACSGLKFGDFAIFGFDDFVVILLFWV